MDLPLEGCLAQENARRLAALEDEFAAHMCPLHLLL